MHPDQPGTDWEKDKDQGESHPLLLDLLGEDQCKQDQKPAPTHINTSGCNSHGSSLQHNLGIFKPLGMAQPGFGTWSVSISMPVIKWLTGSMLPNTYLILLRSFTRKAHPQSLVGIVAGRPSSIKALRQMDKALKRQTSRQPHKSQAILQQAGYFHNNAKRMNYRDMRLDGYPIGSGMVESAVKLQNPFLWFGYALEPSRR